jgi:hypothetical protein
MGVLVESNSCVERLLLVERATVVVATRSELECGRVLEERLTFGAMWFG